MFTFHTLKVSFYRVFHRHAKRDLDLMHEYPFLKKTGIDRITRKALEIIETGKIAKWRRLI